VIFSDAGPDIRWVGNERGEAGDPNWSTVDPMAVPYPGAWSDAVRDALQHGHPQGTAWRPAETNTSIRPGWFYHPAEDGRIKPVEELERVYFHSVGRNSKLLLNLPPAPHGLFGEADLARLAAFRRRREGLLAGDLAVGRAVSWRAGDERTAVLEVDLGRRVNLGLVRLEEEISLGQDVARYSVQGSDGGPWRELSRGLTIGFRKLDRFEPMPARRIRVVVEDAVAPPRPLRIGLYAG
jgi:alpha-L-fucosidase